MFLVAQNGSGSKKGDSVELAVCGGETKALSSAFESEWQYSEEAGSSDVGDRLDYRGRQRDAERVL